MWGSLCQVEVSPATVDARLDVLSVIKATLKIGLDVGEAAAITNASREFITACLRQENIAVCKQAMEVMQLTQKLVK
ncbi:hypothetical protein HK101_011851 [Irineochytrium annulatum]|nr:hypothetical protein HK101_011851 [Irineochytrium annulatum]